MISAVSDRPWFSARTLVRPELAAEVKFLTCTKDNLLRQVVYERLREDKLAAEVRRECRIRNPAGRRSVLSAISSRRHQNTPRNMIHSAFLSAFISYDTNRPRPRMIDWSIDWREWFDIQ